MSFQDFVEKDLRSRGVWPDTLLAEMVESIKNYPPLESMKDRWNDDPRDYPLHLLTALMYNVRAAAKEWVLEHKPDVFWIMNL